jgi:hypothetical protein
MLTERRELQGERLSRISSPKRQLQTRVSVQLRQILWRTNRQGRCGSTMSQELFYGAAHVSDDLSKQDGGYVPATMKRDRRSSPVWMLKLLV